MVDKRKDPYCNIECDKECKDHRANMEKMSGMSKLLWVLLVAVLGSGLWQTAAMSSHDDKDESYYLKTDANTKFVIEQKELNKEILKSLHNIELGVNDIKNKVDNHIGAR